MGVSKLDTVESLVAIVNENPDFNTHPQLYKYIHIHTHTDTRKHTDDTIVDFVDQKGHEQM